LALFLMICISNSTTEVPSPENRSQSFLEAHNEVVNFINQNSELALTKGNDDEDDSVDEEDEEDEDIDSFEEDNLFDDFDADVDDNDDDEDESNEDNAKEIKESSKEEVNEENDEAKEDIKYNEKAFNAIPEQHNDATIPERQNVSSKLESEESAHEEDESNNDEVIPTNQNNNVEDSVNDFSQNPINVNNDEIIAAPLDNFDDQQEEDTVQTETDSTTEKDSDISNKNQLNSVPCTKAEPALNNEQLNDSANTPIKEAHNAMDHTAEYNTVPGSSNDIPNLNEYKFPDLS